MWLYVLQVTSKFTCFQLKDMYLGKWPRPCMHTQPTVSLHHPTSLDSAESLSEVSNVSSHNYITKWNEHVHKLDCMTFVKRVDKAFWYSSTFASVCATCQLFVETQPVLLYLPVFIHVTEWVSCWIVSHCSRTRQL